MADWTATRARKADHLRIALEHDGDLDGDRVHAGFDLVRFIPNALPEIDLGEIDTAISVLGRRLGAPILISSMTGGTDAAGTLNRILAQAAQKYRLAMALGSGRVLLENPRLLPSFDVRRYAPDILLFANLGAVQLNHGVGVGDCRHLVEALRADGLMLHLNPIQEALEVEGDTSFHGLLNQIAGLAASLGAPVIVKEVGFGLAPDVVRRLLDVGVAAVDIAGAGGTAWTRIEGERARTPWRAKVCEDLAEWGMPTARAIRLARAAAPEGLIVGSGGIRTGLDIAKAVALGADLAGIARPFLKVASQGLPTTDDYVQRLIEGLRVAMFGVGVASLAGLRGCDRLQQQAEFWLGE